MEDMLTILESIPIRDPNSNIRLIRCKWITRKASGLSLDKFISNLCGDSSPVLNRYSRNDAKKRYLLPVRLA